MPMPHPARPVVFGLLLAAAAIQATAPAGDAPDVDFSEHAVTVADGQLPGTLTLPVGEGPFPTVVMVHGSGPGDRDQTLGPNRPFRDLAHGLAAHGVASLRYDKRSRVRPADFADVAFTVELEVLADAVSAVATLREHERVDAGQVHVLGLSLGAMLAPRIAERTDAAGMVLLAAPARPLEDMVVEQLEYIASIQTVDTTRQAVLAQLEAMRSLRARIRALEPGDTSTGLLLGAPPAYWLDLRDYDPVAHAAALPQPLLVVHGGRDYQVTDADAARWREVFEDVERARLVEAENLDHLMMPGEGRATPQGYLQPNHVHPGLIALIAEWVHGQR